jgi:hypothetical protein
MSQEARRIPLDFESLKKGDILTVEQLEAITHRQQGTNEYNLAVMQLRGEIERRFAESGVIVSLRTIDNELHILTDDHAVGYSEERFSKGMQIMGRAHNKLLGVDTSKLSDNVKPRHERNVIVQGKILQAVVVAKQEMPKIEPHVRTTPKMGP